MLHLIGHNFVVVTTFVFSYASQGVPQRQPPNRCDNSHGFIADWRGLHLSFIHLVVQLGSDLTQT